MIAGKIIAAIATSTACATALVGIEMLKYVQQKSVDQYRDSSCNFAVNQFQMSEPTAATVVKGGGERREQPDPVRNPELFDEMGNVKWDQVQCTTWKAYPDPHTKWDSLHLSGSDTLEETIAKLKSDHNLALSAWLITLQDENGKTNGKQIYVEPAVDTTIDEELLVQVAPLNLTQQKATMAIMRCKEMGNKQGYSQRWGLLKMTHGKEYLAKMKTPMRTLLESFTGPLGQVSKVKLEFQLEISSARGVEAVTPAVYLDF